MTKIIFFGDNDTTGDAVKVLDAIKKEPNVDQYVFLGDGPYAKEGTKWVGMMKPYFPDTSKLMLTQGNHEHEESESAKTEADIEAWLPSLKDTPETGGGDQSWEKTKWISSKQVGDVFIMCMNSQDLDVEFKRNQYNWVTKQLGKAIALQKSGKVNWIINAVHKPWFTLKSSHSPYTAVREIYSDLFKNVVDMNWHGHNHNDQAWFPMIAIQESGNAAGKPLFTLAADDKTLDFTKERGFITNIQGHSGHEHNAFKENFSANKNVMWANDKTFSYAVMETIGKKANVKWKGIDGKVLFEYNVSKEGSMATTTPPPPPPPQPQPTTDPNAPTSPPPKPGMRWDPATKTWIPKLEDPAFLQQQQAPTTPPPPQPQPPPTAPQPPTTTPKGLVEIHNSDLVLSKVHDVTGGFSSVDPQVDMTNAGQGDKTLHIKEGKDGKNIISFGGERVRWNVFLHKDFRTANDWDKIPMEFANVMYEVEWSCIQQAANLSFSFHTIHDPLSDGGEGFGKFGMHWGIGDGPEVGIKVEYFHNEHGDGHDFALPKPIEVGKKVKVRMYIWNDPTGKREVTQKGEIQYEGDPKWYEVVNFKYTSANWGTPPSGGSKVDRKEYEGGPYMKPGIRMWCRCNGGGLIEVYGFKVYKIVQ
jgi:hypothetical protein